VLADSQVERADESSMIASPILLGIFDIGF
jgi:hypothetical protein